MLHTTDIISVQWKQHKMKFIDLLVITTALLLFAIFKLVHIFVCARIPFDATMITLFAFILNFHNGNEKKRSNNNDSNNNNGKRTR